MSFLAPGALGALALIGVPIVIHLLNKRQVKIVDWAPMKYLKLSLRTSRRKVRLEQLLLLLVRCLFVAALATALGRPTVPREGALGWFAGGARASHVVVLDDSLSMGYAITAGGGSSFDLARAAVARLTEAMAPGDALTLLGAVESERAVVRDAELRTLDVPALLEGLTPSDAAASWEEVLEEAGRVLDRAPYPVRDLVLVTDLRREGWSASVRSLFERLSGEGLSLKVIDVGFEARRNVALLELEVAPGVVVPGVPVELTATLRNDGPEPVGPLTASVLVGETESARNVPVLAPGQVLRLPLEVTFPDAGTQTVTVALPQDALAADDARAVAVDVRADVELLLVDGDPSSETFEGETDFLTVAFTVGDVPWRVYADTDSEWLAAPPARVDLLVLANLASLTREHAQRVEEMVADGMGLMIFPGDQVDPELFELHLHRGGAGVSPAAWGGRFDEGVQGLSVDPAGDSPLAALAALAPEALGTIRARSILEVGIGSDLVGEARVLARWDDAEGRPAVIEKRLGRGRVLLWTVTADRVWSDWPVEPTFLLSVREAARRIADPGAGGLVHRAGAPIALDTRGAPVRQPTLLDADETSVGRLSVVEDEAGSRVAFEGVRRAGTYTARWTAEDGAEVVRHVAVQPATSESDLARLPREELLAWAGALRPQIVHHSELETLLADTGREIWRSLALAALALFAVESLLMVWVGRRG